jgi:hypothetical protein
MSGVGDLLELLHDADLLIGRFEGEFRDWTQPSPSAVLVVQADGIGHRGLRWAGAGPFPRASEGNRRVWFERPNRLRVELVQGRDLLRFGVRDESRWWLWDRVGGTHSGRLLTEGGTWRCPPLLDPPLLSPARLVGWLRFESAGTGVRLGREVVLARARPRRTGELSFEFEFDAQHGIVLHRAAYEKGRCMQVTDALTAKFSAEIDPEVFVFAPPEA